MKDSTVKVILYLINFSLALGVFYFGLPLWTFLFLIPAGFYLQVFASQQYSFRNSIRIEEIPEKGYEQRLAELDSNEEQLSELGFIKFDRFYLPTTSDFVIFAYRHRELPVNLCQYHFGVDVSFDLMTDFENDFTLTTANLKYSAMGELRPPRQLLQTFPELPLEMLFKHHVQSLKFLAQRGFVAQNKPVYNFRAEFMKSFQESSRRLKGLWAPVKVFYLMYFGNKTRFSKSIQEQFLANQLRLP